MRRISGLAEDTLDSQEGLCYIEPVTCLVMYITNKGIQSCAQLKFSRLITVAFPIYSVRLITLPATPLAGPTFAAHSDYLELLFS